MPKHRSLRFALLAAAAGCVPSPPPSQLSAKHSQPSAQVVPNPDTPARRQLAAWLEAFNSGDRQALIAYHERHFPYQVASRDVSSIEREHGLSLGTGGFHVRRFEKSESDRVEVLLQERNRPQYARAYLQVSAEPPHAVTAFRIGPIPTPLELLSPDERKARIIDAEMRGAAIESIASQLQAHYVEAETATRVSARLRAKLARGDYDALTDVEGFADALTGDLRRLARDKHLGLRFGPLPPQPTLDGPAPPWLAQVGYGFGSVARLEGNVAHLVINGFPPLFESQRQAIAERMSAIADADAAIIDLRGNNGGFPPTVMRVASYFFDEQPVQLSSIYRRDTDNTQELWSERELPGQRFGSQKPVYVLTGPRTFSGGEGLAYSLQAQGRALVVGEGTGGGAHPTQPYPVAGGFVLMVPWGESINPITGTNWEGIGVVPDINTPADEALETAHRLALQKLGRR
jgi:retinol-binding protein 3